jgi:hypothetical protein
MAEEAVINDSERIGMLWLDDKGSLGERIERACGYYEKKYGRRATWARVNKRDEDGLEFPKGVDIGFDDTVLPFHVWVGGDVDID